MEPAPASLAFHPICHAERPHKQACVGKAEELREVEDTDGELCASSCRRTCLYHEDGLAPKFSRELGLVVPHQRDEREFQHQCIVGRRVRLSGCTDIALLSSAHFVSASYGAREVYLWRFDLVARRATLLAYTNTTFGGSPVMVDLVDWDGGDQIIISNFKVGAQSIYRVDLKAGTIRWVEEHRAFAPVNTFCGGPCPATRWCHSAKFVPGSPRLIVATSTKPRHFATGVYDRVDRRLLYDFSLDPKWHAQDTEPVGARHLLVAYVSTTVRTRHTEKSSIDNHTAYLRSGKAPLCLSPYQRELTPINTKVVLYAIDLQRPTAHTQLDAFDLPSAHADSIVYSEGLVYLNDQHNDVVHVLSLNMSHVGGGDGHTDGGSVGGGAARQSAMRRVLSIQGYHMPHGVDVRHGMIAVTNYGDNTATIMPLPAELQKYRIAHANEEIVQYS